MQYRFIRNSKDLQRLRKSQTFRVLKKCKQFAHRKAVGHGR